MQYLLHAPDNITDIITSTLTSRNNLSNIFAGISSYHIFPALEHPLGANLRKVRQENYFPKACPPASNMVRNHTRGPGRYLGPEKSHFLGEVVGVVNNLLDT